MEFYAIEETLRRTEELPSLYAALVTPAEWERGRERFQMGIDLELPLRDIAETQAQVNVDSLTGTFAVPVPGNWAQVQGFAFALDERGVVFIDEGDICRGMFHRIAAGKRWRCPSLARFLYDFVEEILRGDAGQLRSLEKELEALEDEILGEAEGRFPPRLNEIRGGLIDLKLYYGQLADLCAELAENENEFFAEEELRYFHLLIDRVDRLSERVRSLQDYNLQLRDLVQTQLSFRQNNIVTFLTVVTTIFVPLTLITGWYGMNFVNMPELNQPWAYPAVIAVSLGIVCYLLWLLRRKKWI